MIQAHGLLLEWASAGCAHRLLNNPLERWRRKGKANLSRWRVLSPNCTSHSPRAASAGVPGLWFPDCVEAAWAEFLWAESIPCVHVPFWANLGSLLHKVLPTKKGRHGLWLSRNIPETSVSTYISFSQLFVTFYFDFQCDCWAFTRSQKWHRISWIRLGDSCLTFEGPRMEDKHLPAV